jgi:hypothetical protein
MKIVTGYGGNPHITSNDDQSLNQGVFGADSYVLNVGNKFARTIVSINEVRIADGEGVMQGVHFRIDPGTYDSVAIENGTSGRNRIDLIVARYEKDSGSGVETVTLEVIKGTPATGTATAPAYTTGNIRSGALLNEMPLYRVNIAGTSISSVTSMFTTMGSLAELVQPTKITVTAGDNVTINRQNVYKIGKLCFASISLTTSATIAGTNSLITGLPTPVAIVDVGLINADYSNGSIINVSGQLRFGRSAGYPAATYSLNCCYITA